MRFPHFHIIWAKMNSNHIFFVRLARPHSPIIFFFETHSKRNVELFSVEILNQLISLPAVTVKGIFIYLFIDKLINHHRPLQIGLEDGTGHYRQASAIIDRDRKD